MTALSISALTDLDGLRRSRSSNGLLSRVRFLLQPGLDTSARVHLVSCRLPVSVTVDEGRPVARWSAGGLATSLLGPHATSGGRWFGWNGATAEPAAEHAKALGQRFADARIVPVPLCPREVEAFYEEISNAVLWPVCHDRLDRLPLRIDGWEMYESVNARFADAVAAEWRPNDLIWVHDYHLMRLPELLRQRLPNARIGFFLHIPFPGPDVFAVLPKREWLLQGLLGADLIGFHTARYRAHFEATARRFCGIEFDDHVARHQGGQLRVGVFPIGIDAEAFAVGANTRRVSARTLELRASARRLIVGIDRLDYSKGIPQRLLALEQLLRRHPEWRGRIRMIQVAVPSRERVGAYQSLRRDLESLIGRINGTFGTPTWTPVHYVHRGVSRSTLLALYRAADVMLVTPLCDGMNLVAKEFAASRTDEGGVLVLSEFAGAAHELTDALLVNPYDVDALADTVHRALTMDGCERRTRMRRLRAQVLENDVHRWSASFVAALTAESDTPAHSLSRGALPVSTNATIEGV